MISDEIQDESRVPVDIWNSLMTSHFSDDGEETFFRLTQMFWEKKWNIPFVCFWFNEMIWICQPQLKHNDLFLIRANKKETNNKMMYDDVTDTFTWTNPQKMCVLSCWSSCRVKQPLAGCANANQSISHELFSVFLSVAVYFLQTFFTVNPH